MALDDLRQAVRQAIAQKDWRSVLRHASEIVAKGESGAEHAEGFFLCGLAHKNMGKVKLAKQQFKASLQAGPNRSDAAIELAEICMRMGIAADAVTLIDSHLEHLENSAQYLNKAGDLLSRAGLHSRAWPVFKKALALQPQNSAIQLNLAGCAAKVGELEEAEILFGNILKAFPGHQRVHYELSKIRRARDNVHVNQMANILDASDEEDARNIFLLFAMGKEYEDLGEWEKAFQCYQRGNSAAHHMAGRQGYEVIQDIETLKAIRDGFSTPADQTEFVSVASDSDPIFIVGLPRSGTTLLEKIITGDTNVESIDETYVLENAAKRYCGLNPNQPFTSAAIQRLAQSTNTQEVIAEYLDKTQYRRQGRAYFIEKYPMNFQYLGLIQRHLPQAKILYLRRSPMDVCFALYKQPHFRFALSLNDLANYYAEYLKLEAHWKNVLGSQIHYLDYEDLVASPEKSTKRVMAFLGLDYSPQLLAFHERRHASASASSAQIREKLYSHSVGKWKNWEAELEPLSRKLSGLGLNLS